MEHSANSKAIVGSIKFFAGLIIIASVIYSEILFLGIISGLFPSGPLAIGAMIGAITTGLSILALCLGKSHWFRPGQQLIVAWTFTLVEVGVLILNDMLAYQLHSGGQLDQFMSTWRLFCVAAPAISLIGWILLFYFDPQRAISHKRMEMEDNQAKAKIDFESSMHRRVMQIQYRTVDMVGSRLENTIEQRVGPHLDRAADIQAARILSQLIGEHVSTSDVSGTPKRIASAKIIDADQTVASSDHVFDPYHIKEKIDAKKKALPSQKDGFFSNITKIFDTSPVTDEDMKLYESPAYERIDEELDTPSNSSNTEDLMQMTIDDRWSEYSKMNEQPNEAPKKKGRTKKQAE